MMMSVPDADSRDRLIELAIAPEDAGARLDRALQRQLPDLSRTRLEAADPRRPGTRATARCCAIRRSARDTTRISSYFLRRPRMPTPAAAADPARYPVRGCTPDRDRQAGRAWSSIPPPGNPDGTLVNALLAHCGASLAGIGGVRRPGIVHRLDKDTSGLIVVAKTEPAHHALSRDFAARAHRARLCRLCLGRAVADRRRDRRQYRPQPGNRKKMAVVARPAASRRSPAIGSSALRARMRRWSSAGWLPGARTRSGFISPHLGHPLIGDPVYGTRAGRAVARARAGRRRDCRLPAPGPARPAARLHPSRRPARRCGSRARCRRTS